MADIKSIAVKLATNGPHKVLPSTRLIQIIFSGTYIARTSSSQLVWEHPFYPQYYLPTTAIKSSHITSRTPIVNPANNETIAEQWTLEIPSPSSSSSSSSKARSTDQVVAFSDKLSGPAESLRNLVKISFDAMDQWLEESTPIHVHPKDPFKRVDLLSSTRRVRVLIDDIVVADTPWSVHLYETMLPRRFYLPLTAIVDPSVLRPTETKTKCPYKGTAEYYSVDLTGKGGGVHEDVIWYYENPTPECSAVTGMVCFYNEKVDIELDGEKLERADTHFKNNKPGVKPSI